MEVLIKKCQQKYRNVRDDIERWDELQSRLLAQFRNASAIIERLPVLQDPRNYVGGLGCVSGLMETLTARQMMSLDSILRSIDETVKEIHSIVRSLDKILRDGRNLVRGGSVSLTETQMHLHIGIKPSIADCLEGLRLIHEMYHSEYLLKLSAVSRISSIMLKMPACANELANLEQNLVGFRKMSRVYVGNLDSRVSERELEDEFRVYGVLRSVWVARKPPGYAFLDFDDRRDALDAIRALDGKNGWRVELSHNSRGGGGGGDRGGGRGGGVGGGRGRSGGSDLKCYECGEPGHFARECHSRGGSGRRRSRSPRYRRSPSYGRKSYSPRARSPKRRSISPRGRSYSRSPKYERGREASPKYERGREASPKYERGREASPKYERGREASPKYERRREASPYTNGNAARDRRRSRS